MKQYSSLLNKNKRLKMKAGNWVQRLIELICIIVNEIVLKTSSLITIIFFHLHWCPDLYEVRMILLKFIRFQTELNKMDVMFL